MVQTNNRFFDEIGRLMNGAAGMTQGLRREIETLMRGQAERILSELDVVRRDEFEAVKDMARLAREENESLRARIAALEGGRPGGPSSPGLSEPHAGAGARSAPTTASPLAPEAAGLAGSGTGVENRDAGLHGASAAGGAEDLPSGGVESAGRPKSGRQTPSSPSAAAGDPSI